jgi:hypothetical protein
MPGAVHADGIGQRSGHGSTCRRHITYLSRMTRPRRGPAAAGPRTRAVIWGLRGEPDRSDPCRGAATA